MQQILLSSTGNLSTIVINDLGGRTFTHPVSNVNLLNEYTTETIRDSVDLQFHITNNNVILTDGTTVITNLKANLDLAAIQVDVDGNGIVDNAAQLNGQSATFYIDRSNHTGTQTADSISNFNTAVVQVVTSPIVASSGTSGYASFAGTAYIANNSTLLNNQNASFYLSRANHTGTQLVSTISNLSAGTSGYAFNAANAFTANNAILLNSNNAAFYLSRTNHTGTQVAATISNFTSTVLSSTSGYAPYAGLAYTTNDTASNGLTKTGNNFTLGGTVASATTLTLNNTLTINASTSGTLKYSSDVSSTFTDRSIVDRGWTSPQILNNPTFQAPREVFKLTQSTGHLNGGDVVDTGGGTIAVSGGQGFIRGIDSDLGTLYSFDWATVTGLVIPNNSVRYVLVTYNSGNPIVTLSAVENIDYHTSFGLGFVVNENGTLYISNTPHSIGQGVTRLIQKDYEVAGITRASGLILGCPIPLFYSVTEGATWFKGVRDVIPAVDTSVSGSFDAYYQNGIGGFFKQTLVNVPNTTYDDGSGSLATLGNNRYGIYWFYIGPSGASIMVYGNSNLGNLNDTLAVSPPTTLPLRLQVKSLLIGRVVVLKNASDATIIDSAFNITFDANNIIIHNDLTSIQGGAVGEYYHLTLAQYNNLSNNNPVSSGTSGWAADAAHAYLADTATNSTLLNSNNAAFYLNRTNHTGTQLVSTISNLSAGTSGYAVSAGSAFTANNATQLNSQAAAFYLSRTNHTGTQLVSSISNLTAGTSGYAFSAGNAFTANNAALLNNQTASFYLNRNNHTNNIAADFFLDSNLNVRNNANVGGITYSTSGFSTPGTLRATGVSTLGVVNATTLNTSNGVNIVGQIHSIGNVNTNSNINAQGNIYSTSGFGTTASVIAGSVHSNGIVSTNNSIYIMGGGSLQGTAGFATNADAAYSIRSATTAVDVWQSAAPTQGQFLIATGTTTAIWQNIPNAEVSAVASTNITNAAYGTGGANLVHTTPAAGTYLIMWSAVVAQSNNNQSVFAAPHIGGTIITNCERQHTRPAAGAQTISGSTIGTVNGSQDIDLRFRVSANTGTITARNILIVKIGT